MRILILLLPDLAQVGADPAPALQFERFVEPYYLFLDAGADVVLATPEGGDPVMRAADGARRAKGSVMDRFHNDLAAREALADTVGFADVVISDFDAAYCVGVPGPAQNHPRGRQALDLIFKLLSLGKPVATVPGWIQALPEPCEGVLIIGEGVASPRLAAGALFGAVSRMAET